jgi:hypothetical protein
VRHGAEPTEGTEVDVAYDQELDQRVSDAVASWAAVRKTMFGGSGYMIHGNLFGGVYKDRLLVRLGAEEGEAALREPGVLPFDMMPRPMPGWVTVGASEVKGAGLVRWLERGRAYAESLPPK